MPAHKNHTARHVDEVDELPGIVLMLLVLAIAASLVALFA